MIIRNTMMAALVGTLLLSGITSLSTGAQELRADMSKMGIERPTKRLLSVPYPLTMEKIPGNRKVQPGLVRWHRDFATASQAAKSSGKPVLCFQMMGKLDQEYC